MFTVYISVLYAFPAFYHCSMSSTGTDIVDFLNGHAELNCHFFEGRAFREAVEVALFFFGDSNERSREVNNIARLLQASHQIFM